MPLGQAPDQGRLADAGLAHDQHDPAPIGRRGQRVGDPAAVALGCPAALDHEQLVDLGWVAGPEHVAGLLHRDVRAEVAFLVQGTGRPPEPVEQRLDVVDVLTGA
jgi:hypothetical protein